MIMFDRKVSHSNSQGKKIEGTVQSACLYSEALQAHKAWQRADVLLPKAYCLFQQQLRPWQPSNMLTIMSDP